jgi:adenylyl-sulfate kinase
MPKSKNIYWTEGEISKSDREKLSDHRGICLWFTGLPASGKSSIAREAEKLLYQKKINCYVLDGDNIRHGLNSDLGFSADDRTENIRRIGEVAKLFVDAGIIILTAFISPYQADRQRVREIMAPGDFIEIYVEADIETCEKRDTKGLYRKARLGEIKDFTGISAPYEVPEKPELILNTTKIIEVKEHAKKVVNYLEKNGYLIHKEKNTPS